MTDIESYLKNNESFIKSIFNFIQGGMIILDRDLTIVYVNKWLEEKFTSKMPLVGKKCYEVFLENKEACHRCSNIIENNINNGKSDGYEFPSTLSIAECFNISVSGLEDDEGNIIGIIGHIKDISEFKIAEEMFIDEINRKRMLLNQSRDGIVILDLKGRVCESNQKYADMLGYTMEEVLQLHVWDWDTQWTKEELLGMIQTVDEKGDHFVTKHKRKDGSFYDVEISTNGSIYRGQKFIFCVCRDITERKQAEEEREKLILELQEAIREIKILRKILPICSICKKVRDDKGYWEQVDVYIQ